LLNALLQGGAALPPSPVRRAMQNQSLSQTLRAFGAQQLQPDQPPPQASDLQQLISSVSADTLLSLLSSSGNK